MDEKLKEKIKELFNEENIVIGKNAIFKEHENNILIELTKSKNETYQYNLKSINELYEGDDLYNSSYDKWDDKYMPLLLCIETAIYGYYQDNKGLKDKIIINILEKLILNPDLKRSNELYKKIQNNIKLCMSLNKLSKKELIGVLNKILKSVKNHHKIDGAKGYLEFLKIFFRNK